MYLEGSTIIIIVRLVWWKCVKATKKKIRFGIVYLPHLVGRRVRP